MDWVLVNFVIRLWAAFLAFCLIVCAPEMGMVRAAEVASDRKPELVSRLNDLARNWARLDQEAARRVWLAAREKARRLGEEARAFDAASALVETAEAAPDAGAAAEEAEALREALDRVRRLNDRAARDRLLRRLSVFAGRSDVKPAGTLAEAIHDPSVRAWAWRELGEDRSERDRVEAEYCFTRAYEASAGISDPFRRVLAGVKIGAAWGRLDAGYGRRVFEDLLPAAAGIGEPEAGAAALAALACEWGRVDVDRAAQAALLIAEDRPEARFLVWMGLAEAEDEAGRSAGWLRAALDQADALEDGLARDKALGRAAVFLAEREPDRAG